MEREFFKDGMYSLLRFICGGVCSLSPSLFMPICFGYVIADSSNKNIANDLQEMLAGFLYTNILVAFARLTC
jgi:hypothetical protein